MLRVAQGITRLWRNSPMSGRIRLALALSLPPVALILFVIGQTLAGVVVAVVIVLDAAIVGPALMARARVRQRRDR